MHYISSLSLVTLLVQLVLYCCCDDLSPLHSDNNNMHIMCKYYTHNIGKRESPIPDPGNGDYTDMEEYDDHKYYTSLIYNDRFDQYWVDISQIGTPSVISDKNRYYTITPLLFDFPFYGHYINNVGITTQGFISTAEIFHPQLHFSQFIAPFSSDFIPAFTNLSNIYYLSSAQRFVVQWNQLYLNSNTSIGNFTFQLQIYPTGEIIFVYKSAPLSIKQAESICNVNCYPSFIGLADGFLYNLTTSRFILYHYHNTSINTSLPLSRSVIVFTPKLNCVKATNNSYCSTITTTTEFDCEWCEAIQHCSDGIDRRRYDWLTNNCPDDTYTLQYSSSIAEYIVLPIVLFIVTILGIVGVVGVVIWVMKHRRKIVGFYSSTSLVSHSDKEPIIQME